MKKILLASLCFILANIFYIASAKADDSYLVILEGYGTEGNWWPTTIIKYQDDWMTGQERCSLALQSLASHESRPHFFYCTIERPRIK